VAGFAGGGAAASALFHMRRMQSFSDKLRSTAETMAYSTALGLTAHLDQVLFPTPGPAAPEPDPVEPRSVPDVRLVDRDASRGKALVRLQMNFLQNQNDPALPELKERLRNQFQYFGDDMLMTGSIGEWAAPLGAGAVWREAQRLVAQAGWHNENSVQDIKGLQQVVEAYEEVNKEFNITPHRWVVHHVPSSTPTCCHDCATLGCGVQMAAFRGSRRPRIPNRSSARRSGPSSITAFRRASTVTACTSRRSTRGCTSTSRRRASTRMA
jgi:predicted amidohydrolase YtcJ